MRASYAILDHYEVLKVSQDTSANANIERFVLYFFLGPAAGSNYTVYRAIVDYDKSETEAKIFILAFDPFVLNNALVSNAPIEAEVATQKLDIDIAYGYEPIPVEKAKSDKNVGSVLAQIANKYESLVRSSTLDKVEAL